MKASSLAAVLALFVFGASAHAQRTQFILTVPSDATITVDGQPTVASDQETRQFQTGPLDPNRWYCHNLVITVTRNGRTFSQKDRILFHAGEQIRRSYLNLLNDAEYRNYPRAQHILGEVRGFDQRKVREIQALAAREKSNNVLISATAGLSAKETARLAAKQMQFVEDLDGILRSSADGGLTDVDIAAVSDVTFERLASDRLQAILEVRRSSKTHRLVNGTILVRDTVHYHCIYEKFNGDWMLERYWSTGGDSVGDFLIRWENNLRRMTDAAAPESLAGVRPTSPISQRTD